jgi:hypothetical protein
MANLSAVNPNLGAESGGTRRSDIKDDSLVIGTFAAISASDTAETGIALKAEALRDYRAVVHYASNVASDGGDTNYWAISIRGADNSSFTNEVTLATYNTFSSSGATKAYLALSGESTESLRTAAGEDEVVYIRSVATKVASPSNLTGGVYLTCD